MRDDQRAFAGVGCQDGGDGTDGGAQGFITWPAFGDFDDEFSSRWDYSQLAAVVRDGNATTIDFTDGTVERPGMDNSETSQALAGLDADFIRSLDIYADSPIRFHVPDVQEQTPVGMLENEFRDVQLRDVQIKQLKLRAFDEPARVVVLASTRPRMGFATSGGPLKKHRVGVELSDQSSFLLELDDSWTTQYFAPESVVINDSAGQLSVRAQELWVPQGGSATLEVHNTNQYDVGISAQANNYMFKDGRGTKRFTSLPGWTEDSPKVVPGNETRIFDLANALEGPGVGVTYVQFRGKQIEESGQTSDVRMNLAMDIPR